MILIVLLIRASIFETWWRSAHFPSQPAHWRWQQFRRLSTRRT